MRGTCAAGTPGPSSCTKTIATAASAWISMFTWLPLGAHASALSRTLVRICDTSPASATLTPGAWLLMASETPARCASTDSASTTSLTTASSGSSRSSMTACAPMARRARSRAVRARSSTMARARLTCSGDPRPVRASVTHPSSTVSALDTSWSAPVKSRCGSATGGGSLQRADGRESSESRGTRGSYDIRRAGSRSSDVSATLPRS